MKRVICVFVVALMAGSASAAFIGGPDFDTSDAVTATSPNWNGSGVPAVVVNGAGLDGTGEMHDNQPWNGDPVTSWLGEGNSGAGQGGGAVKTPNPGTHWNDTDPNWMRFDFDGVYPIASARIWNYNGELTGRGFNQVIVEYTANGSDWSQVAGPGEEGAVTFPKAPGGSGENDYTGFTLDFGGVDASSVVFTVLRNESFVKNHADSGNVGLSEVRFNIVPEPATIGLLVMGGLALLRKKR